MGFKHAVIAALLATGNPGSAHIEIATLPSNRNEIDFYSGNVAEVNPARIIVDPSATLSLQSGELGAGSSSLVLHPGSGAATPGIVAATGGFVVFTADSVTLDTTAGAAKAIALLAARLDIDGEDVLAPWTAYTPSWSGALGNGSLAAVVARIGKLVHFRIKLTWGTTTTHGAGGQTFGLPRAARSAFQADTPIAHASFTQAGVKTVNGVANWSAGDKAVCMLCDAAGTFVTNVQPFVWANTHVLQLAGSYEAA